MHEHSFFNIILELFSNCHHIQLRSCACPCLGAWLCGHPFIPSFRMVFNIFSSILCARLGVHHPMVHGFSRCIRGQAINPIKIHLFCCVHGESAKSHMMQFEILSPPLLRMLGHMFCISKHIFSRCHFFNHHDDK